MAYPSCAKGGGAIQHKLDYLFMLLRMGAGKEQGEAAWDSNGLPKEGLILET